MSNNTNTVNDIFLKESSSKPKYKIISAIRKHVTKYGIENVKTGEKVLNLNYDSITTGINGEFVCFNRGKLNDKTYTVYSPNCEKVLFTTEGSTNLHIDHENQRYVASYFMDNQSIEIDCLMLAVLGAGHADVTIKSGHGVTSKNRYVNKVETTKLHVNIFEDELLQNKEPLRFSPTDVRSLYQTTEKMLNPNLEVHSENPSSQLVDDDSNCLPLVKRALTYRKYSLNDSSSKNMEEIANVESALGKVESLMNLDSEQNSNLGL